MYICHTSFIIYVMYWRIYIEFVGNLVLKFIIVSACFPLVVDQLEFKKG